MQYQNDKSESCGFHVTRYLGFVCFTERLKVPPNSFPPNSTRENLEVFHQARYNTWHSVYSGREETPALQHHRSYQVSEMLTAHCTLREKLDLDLGDQLLKMEAVLKRKNQLSSAQPDFSPMHTTATAYLSLHLF